MNPQDDLVSQAAAAKLRGVDRAAIADLIKRGRLKTINVGGVPFLRRKDVVNFQPQKRGHKPRDGSK